MTQDSPERKSEAAVGKLIGVADGEEPLADLKRRGLVRIPSAPRTPHHPAVKASSSVSDLIPDQRR